jgi:hypothetical protein
MFWPCLAPQSSVIIIGITVIPELTFECVAPLMMGFDTNSELVLNHNNIHLLNHFILAALFFSGIGTIIFYLATGGKG